MEKNLLKTLKELKKIQPNSDYFKQSRFLILQTNPESVKETRLSMGFIFGNLKNILSLNPVRLVFSAAALILIFGISGGFYFVNDRSNQNKLVAQASEINASIQVNLDEIKYLLENEPYPAIESVLEIRELLGRAAQELETISLSDNKNIDESLKKIKLAQETLSQINLLLEK